MRRRRTMKQERAGRWRMEFRQIRLLEKMFQYRGDALVIACLSDGPLRFSELSKAIVRRAHVHMADAQLGRCLMRLVDHGLLEHTAIDDLLRYRLTATGSRKASTLLFLNAAV